MPDIERSLLARIAATAPAGTGGPGRRFGLIFARWRDAGRKAGRILVKLIKEAAKVVRHAKYVTFQMAEVAVPHELFAAILERLQRFGVPPPLVQGG